MKGSYSDKLSTQSKTHHQLQERSITPRSHPHNHWNWIWPNARNLEARKSVYHTFPKTSHHQHFQLSYPNGTYFISQVSKRIIYTEISSSSNECIPTPIQEILSTTNSHTLRHWFIKAPHHQLWGAKIHATLVDREIRFNFLRGKWGGSNTKNKWSHWNILTLKHWNRDAQEHNPWHNRNSLYQSYPALIYTNIPAPRLMPPDAHPTPIQTNFFSNK